MRGHFILTPVEWSGASRKQKHHFQKISALQNNSRYFLKTVHVLTIPVRITEMEALFGLSRCFFYIILIKNLLATVACGSSQTEPLYGVDNPVEFIGYEDGDLDVTDAEIEIGRELTDTSIETVFVVSTLLWNNSIYVPWNCTKPESRQVSVYDGRHLNLTIPLSYVYGKPGHFTLGFLSFPAPLRYLSLSTLSQKVAWLKKGLALRLRVRSDSTSEEIWLNSNGDGARHCRQSTMHATPLFMYKLPCTSYHVQATMCKLPCTSYHVQATMYRCTEYE